LEIERNGAEAMPIEFPKDILAAYARIRKDIRRTPLEPADELGRAVDARVLVKWESDQITGSFKLRGALNKLRALTPGERSRGVVSASTGNHGLAIAHAARLEGVGLTLFLPRTAAAVKRAKIEALGFDIRTFGDDCGATEVHARQYAEGAGKVFVSPYNDTFIIAGQGTIGVEVLEDVPDVDDVLVAIGGGGLIAGIAGYLKAVKPGTRIVGVEPETSAFMKASVKAGRLVSIEEGETVADAVAGGMEPGAITFPLCRDLVDDILTVTEVAIVAAMEMVHRWYGRRIEGAAALPVAGLLGEPGRFRGRKVVCIASGGNIDPGRFDALIGAVRSSCPS
jgi:threonine dehydratase